MLIIARFKEDVSWSDNLDCIIYNKFKGKNKLENIGREAHTYLTHIVNNYDNLTDCIFTQANPFDHCPNFLELIKTPFKDFTAFNLLEIDNYIRYDGIYRYNVLIESIEFKDLTVKLLGIFGIEKEVIRSSYFGIFGVSKERMLRYSKEQYLKALELSKEPLFAYSFEIIWRELYI